MKDAWNTYDALASAMTYPDTEFESKLADCLSALDEADKSTRDRVAGWAEHMRDMTPEAREEAYTRAFDMSPRCTLEIGWHLFGETYDRGTFLVWMRGQLQNFSLEEATDLPDHIRHVLPVLGRMDGADADKFSSACVLTSLETIREGLKGLDSPYETLIDAICDWLESRHGASIKETGSLPILNEHEELLHAEDL